MDNRDADITHSEAAEPLAKKRVAFKDDLVDDADTDSRRLTSMPVPRRSFNAPPPTPLEDLTATTDGMPSLPRPNRGPRGRPGSVGGHGKRPLAR